MRLRKKPVEIEGFQMTAPRMQAYGWGNTRTGWPIWAKKAFTLPVDTPGALFYRATDTVWFVKTLEGVANVSVDDWILRGVKGELYPCKPDVLALTYDVLGPDEEGT